MENPGADVDTPTSQGQVIDIPAAQEQVVGDSPQSPGYERVKFGETEDETANKGVLALLEFLKGMKEDDEDAGGDVQELREMLKKGSKAYINTKGPEGVAPLHLAAERGLEKAAKLIIEAPGAKANISIRSDKDWQPLHYACEEGKLKVAELLIANGADINV
ncbi:hypothetical protein SLS64_005855 [Diaporthe eres]|uniref:Ankyrin repeat protein n=1 Tax=Diaporthe eres TaxID=83184 RepID=A0ABR1NY41_DIAER